MRAPELLESGEHFPKDFGPGKLLLSQEHDEFVDVPELITLMLHDGLAVSVDEGGRVRAVHPLSLVV